MAFITPCPAKVTAAKVPLGNTRRNINAAIAISRVYPALIQEIKKMQPEEFMQLSRMGSTGISWAANSGESTGSGQRRYIEPMNVMSLDSDPARSLELFAKMQSYERKFPGLDCGSCGSPTCHALAEDIVRGYRTEDDCIYLLKEKLEKLAQSLAGLSSHITPMEEYSNDGE